MYKNSVKRKVLSVEELPEYLPKLNWNEIAFDTETTSLKFDTLEITGLSLCDGEYNVYIPIEKH